MREFLSSLVAEYGQQVVIIFGGIIVRWWEKSRVKAFYRERIDRLIREVKEAKYGKSND